MRASDRAPYSIAGWFLAALFAARVLGQAVQRWAPKPFLPPADAFQGSNLPYEILLGVQVVILAAMLWFSWRMQSGRMAPSHRAGTFLAWTGGLYMSIAVARIAIGLAMPGAHAWFRTWIPAIFHVVLAAFVLTVSLYHLRARGEP